MTPATSSATSSGMSSTKRDELFGRIAERLKALADPNRLRILHALENRERTVSDLLAELGGSQANLSKHLARMRLAGILASRRQGTSVHYRVADPAAFAVCRTVCDAIDRQAVETRSTIRGGRGRLGGRK